MKLAESSTLCVCACCRSVKLAESSAVDDVMSECNAVLMHEQVDILCDTDTGTFNFYVIFTVVVT